MSVPLTHTATVHAPNRPFTPPIPPVHRICVVRSPRSADCIGVSTLRVVVADDERPARALLVSTLKTFPDVEIVGEAAGGEESVALIERTEPDLALLDLQMPEVDGLAVVRLIHPDRLPLVAFVTAYDEYAVQAFGLNAVDYLLKPVEPTRLHATLIRARERLATQTDHAASTRAAAAAAERLPNAPYLLRIPVRHRDAITILPVERVLTVRADGELLHIFTHDGHRHTVTHRLKDLEARLDPTQFVRLSRSVLVNIDAIRRVSAMPGGTYTVTLANSQTLPVSRNRARALRELFRL
jgi:two-component system, LytTR family, response regulator